MTAPTPRAAEAAPGPGDTSPYDERTGGARVPVLQTVRHQRAGLREAMITLESAVAAPVPGRVAAWGFAVHDALAELASAFERHLAVTEGSHGLFRDIVASAPHLARATSDVRADHEVIAAKIREVTAAARHLDPVPVAARSLRERVVELLATLARHRQMGADLVYDAFATDIGGSE